MDDGKIHVGQERSLHIALVVGHMSGVVAGYGLAHDSRIGLEPVPVAGIIIGIAILAVGGYASFRLCPTAKHIALTYEEIEVFEEGGGK